MKGIVEEQMEPPEEHAAEGQAGEAAEPEHGQGPRPATDKGHDLLYAVMGAMFDDRAGAAEKIIAAAQASRDPLGVIAGSAYDLVLAVSEKINFNGPNKAAIPVVMMVFGQLCELADAAGIPFNAAASTKAAKGLMARLNGEDEGAEVEGQEPNDQAEDAAEGETDDMGGA